MTGLSRFEITSTGPWEDLESHNKNRPLVFFGTPSTTALNETFAAAGREYVVRKRPNDSRWV